jgi:hypothetical protein
LNLSVFANTDNRGIKIYERLNKEWTLGLNKQIFKQYVFEYKWSPRQYRSLKIKIRGLFSLELKIGSRVKWYFFYNY